MSRSKQKLVIAGAYGCGNAGDDAILAGLLKLFSPDNYNITVFTADPDQTRRQFGVHPVQQKLNVGFSLRIARDFQFIHIIKAICAADILIIGGGALIHDLRVYNLPYFFALHALASMAGARIFYYGIGAGPLTTPLGRWLCRRMLSKADHLSVRDDEGKVWLEKAGVHTNIQVTADPAFALTEEDVPGQTVQALCDREGVPRSFISTTLCGWFQSADFWNREKLDLSRRIERMAEIYSTIIEKYKIDILFIPTVVPYDRDIAVRIQKQMRQPSRFHFLSRDYPPAVLMGVIGRSRWLLGMRLHSMIFATILAIPFAAIIYDQKVTNYLKRVHNTHAIDLRELDTDKIYNTINTMLADKKALKDRFRKLSAEFHRSLYRE